MSLNNTEFSVLIEFKEGVQVSVNIGTDLKFSIDDVSTCFEYLGRIIGLDVGPLIPPVLGWYKAVGINNVHFH